jgi:uncharacterized membrane protein
MMPIVETTVDERASEVERTTAFAIAAVLLTYGLGRRSVPGLCMAATAAPFAYRGLTGRWPRLFGPFGSADDARVVPSGDRGVHLREAIRLETPLAEVYAFWRRLENLPRFMHHLQEVTDLGEKRSHWVAKGPAGMRVEWDAEIINEVEHQVIGWRSLPGADVVTAGSVNFDSVRAGRSTQVSVHLQYAPPAGHAGAFFARLFGREPSQTIREDLRRLKQLLESGEIPRAAENASAR